MDRRALRCCLLDSIAHMNPQQLWYLHKICARSSQLKSYNVAWEELPRPHLQLRNCGQLMTAEQEGITFL